MIYPVIHEGTKIIWIENGAKIAFSASFSIQIIFTFTFQLGIQQKKLSHV
jgi:hypothetical protein